MMDYLKEFQEKYQELRNQRKDIYTIEFSFGRFIVALPDKDRMTNINDSVKLTVEDVNILMNLFPKIPLLGFINRDVFQYEDSEDSEALKLSNLEEVLKSGKSMVCKLDTDVCSLAQ